MYRFVVLFVVSALVAARAPIPSFELESNHIDSIGEEESFLPFSQLNAIKTSGVTNVISPAQLTAVPRQDSLIDTFRYTFGKRVANDSLVSGGTGANSWPTPQDLTLSFVYPLVGRGVIVTYVEIDVRQDSNVGEAKVVSGGIGQRSIAIDVKAGRIYHLGYSAYFYGMQE